MINIGLDLDNTIINYSETFYEVALEKKLIPKNFSKNFFQVQPTSQPALEKCQRTLGKTLKF